MIGPPSIDFDSLSNRLRSFQVTLNGGIQYGGRHVLEYGGAIENAGHVSSVRSVRMDSKFVRDFNFKISLFLPL